MAADEHQPQHIVLDMINCGEEVLFRHLVSLPASDGGVDLIKAVAAPKLIDCPALGDRHQPGAGVIGYAGCRPLLQRGYQRVLSEVLR